MEINISFDPAPARHKQSGLSTSDTEQSAALAWNYRTFLMGRCRQLTRGNREDANDLFSRVMLKLCSEPPAQTDPIRHLGGWLYRVAQNQYIDDQRERQAMARRDDELTFLSTAYGADAPSPEQQYLNQELRRHLRLAFERLPPRLQAAARMRFHDEAPYEEIAAHLAINEALARKLIQEARKLLSEYLRPYVGPRRNPANGHR
ncbi:RNA polymerase sigma factor [Duganella sp. HH105]|uniref:RNA polymerase sigma factor n=1 Tax=Duganella sp. HH105 TaxID=1781067 RepID=UPI000877B011|nr:sigma-70 family RNA polymerase sigma factor [Duganella sp. HH105]OEZ62012.1 ECF RNA polymerase sigma factor SigE [Duganella sp. HH105]